MGRKRTLAMKTFNRRKAPAEPSVPTLSGAHADQRCPSGTGQTATPPARCEPQLDPRQIALAVSRLKSTSELDLDLTRLVADLDQKLALFNRYAQLARDLRSDLQAGE